MGVRFDASPVRAYRELLARLHAAAELHAEALAVSVAVSGAGRSLSDVREAADVLERLTLRTVTLAALDVSQSLVDVSQGPQGGAREAFWKAAAGLLTERDDTAFPPPDREALAVAVRTLRAYLDH